ncbi:MAG: hypothetical protein JWO82_3756, partial [Akkermansiaceae bacterium]|nr:hypothetical protein [Akkermansiaceae bacterium]
GPAAVIEKTSPDGTLKAVALRTAYPGHPSNRDGDSFRLTILSPDSGATRYSIELRPRRGVDQMRWSPDSKFLVLITSSSGGHSPMNEATFVYCRPDGSLRRLSNYRDDTSVTGSGIGFTGPNTAMLEVHESSSDDEDSNPHHAIAVPLEQEFLAMPQESSASDPDEIPPVLTLASRDRKWFAAARCIPDEGSPWQTGLDGFRLVIRTPDRQGEEILHYDSPRQRVAEMQWSPDNRYLVLTTRSADGDAPGHWQAWVWRADDRSLRTVPESILGGALNHRAIYFSGPDTVNLYVIVTGSGEEHRQSMPLKLSAENLPKVETDKLGK